MWMIPCTCMLIKNLIMMMMRQQQNNPSQQRVKNGSHLRTLVKSVYRKFSFLISQPKHVVGTQKNRLNETVLLSTQNIC